MNNSNKLVNEIIEKLEEIIKTYKQSDKINNYPFKTNVIYKHKSNDNIGFMPEVIVVYNDQFIMSGYDMDISSDKKHFSIRKNEHVISKYSLDEWEEVKQAYSTSIYSDCDFRKELPNG